MGRFKLIHEFVFPVTEILRPIRPSPGCRWPSCCGRPTSRASSSSPSSDRSFPILVNTLHGMTLVDPVLVRASQCLGAREMSIFREVVLSRFAAAHLHRPDGRAWASPGCR